MQQGDEGTEIVRRFIRDRSLGIEIRTLAKDSTRTSAMAAEALGCSIAQIAKSIAFFCRRDGVDVPVIVVLSGDRRVETNKLKAVLGADEARKMDADEVMAFTGYIIGGVPPFPHRAGLKVIVDESLFKFDIVYAAAGSPSSIMSIPPILLTSELAFSREDVSV